MPALHLFLAPTVALLAALVGAVTGPALAQPVPDLPPRVVAPTDQAQFRRLVLDNGLRVMLVSDPRFNKSAASMLAGVGQIDDPRETPGMAHFLEHVLSRGNAKYPGENEFLQYIDRNGGRRNAFTGSDYTGYHFEVRHDALDGALDRLAHCFISPALLPDMLAREVSAVHNESMRNIQADGWRITGVMREVYDPASGESKFSTGKFAVKFLDQFVRTGMAKGVDERTVVPERAFLPACEARPKRIAEPAQVPQNGAGVVQFVRRGDQPHRGRCLGNMGNVVFLAFAPGWLGDDHRVRAALHDVGHSIAEAQANVLDAANAAGVFTRIVQERADGFIFIRAVLQGNARDTKQVGEIGDLGVLALLEGMDEHGVVQGLVELW